MKKILLLAFQNIRKSKSQYISYGIITLLAALLLHIGIITVLNFTNTFEDKAKEANVSDLFAIVKQEKIDEQYVEDIKNNELIKSYEERDVLTVTGELNTPDGEKYNYDQLMYNMDEEHSMNKLTFIEKGTEDYVNPVYISCWMKYNSGFEIGGKYSIKTVDSVVEFTVAGFVEDMQYGNYNTGNVAIFLPDSSYKYASLLVPKDSEAVVYDFELYDESDVMDVKNSFASYGYRFYDADTVKTNRTMTSTIFTTIIIAFAIVILVVSILVCNFRISNSIQEEMTSFGALKALGYTGKQILASTIMPYILVSSLTSIIGIAGSYIVLPVLEKGLRLQTGFLWEQGFSLLSLVITFVFINVLMGMVIYLFASKVKKLTPIKALRGGIETHNFRKNRFDMTKTPGSASFVLSLKNFASNVRQNILLFIVLLAIAFSCIFTGVMFYNINVEPVGFISAMSEETPSATLDLGNKRNDELLDDIRKMDNVNRALYYDSYMVTYKYDSVPVVVMDDYSEVKNDICYEGRNPKHDNEIAIGSALADKYDMKIGDSIRIKCGENENEYVITGFLQAVNYSGIIAEVTTKGALINNPSYEPHKINVYLDDEDRAQEFIDNVLDTHNKDIVGFTNLVESMENALGMFLTIMRVMAIVMIILTTVIILLILFLIIKTVTVHNKQEYGILKSIGYTTRQLVFQMSCSFMPTAIVATAVAGVLGLFCTNAVLKVVFRSLSIMSLNFSVPVPMVLAICIGIVILTYALSTLISLRIRKVSAYSLISE